MNYQVLRNVIILVRYLFGSITCFANFFLLSIFKLNCSQEEGGVLQKKIKITNQIKSNFFNVICIFENKLNVFLTEFLN